MYKKHILLTYMKLQELITELRMAHRLKDEKGEGG